MRSKWLMGSILLIHSSLLSGRRNGNTHLSEQLDKIIILLQAVLETRRPPHLNFYSILHQQVVLHQTIKKWKLEMGLNFSNGIENLHHSLDGLTKKLPCLLETHALRCRVKRCIERQLGRFEQGIFLHEEQLDTLIKYARLDVGDRQNFYRRLVVDSDFSMQLCLYLAEVVRPLFLAEIV